MNRAIALSCLALCACGGSAANSGGAMSPAKEEPTIVKPADKKAETPELAFSDAESAFEAAGNDCAQMCKALTSMTNATDRLCELAKENGDSKRCDDAKQKLDGAKAKVKSTCGGCS